MAILCDWRTGLQHATKRSSRYDRPKGRLCADRRLPQQRQPISGGGCRSARSSESTRSNGRRGSDPQLLQFLLQGDLKPCTSAVGGLYPFSPGTRARRPGLVQEPVPDLPSLNFTLPLTSEPGPRRRPLSCIRETG